MHLDVGFSPRVSASLFQPRQWRLIHLPLTRQPNSSHLTVGWSPRL